MASNSLVFNVDDLVKESVLVNKRTEGTIFLTNTDGSLKCGEEHAISLVLLFEDGTVCPEEYLSIDNPLTISSCGSCKLVFSVSILSLNCDGKKFILEASSNILGHAICARSVIFSCVRQRLQIINPSTIPSLWFKDGGGREKDIEFIVNLIGEDGTTIKYRQVDLRAVLIYANGMDVLKQDILSLNSNVSLNSFSAATSTGSKLSLVDGSCTIKFRINDVSKNHQQQLFSVMIVPDTTKTPLNGDIASVKTPAILVKSKPKKEKELRERSVDSDGEVADQKYINKVNGSSGAPKDLKKGLLDLNSKNRGGDAVLSSSYEGSLDSFRPLSHQYQSHQPPPQQQKQSGYQNSWHPGPGSISSTSDLPLGQSGKNRQLVAIQNVVRWAGLVINSLQVMQWKLVGYDQKSDGSPNMAHPLFTFENPNNKIKNIIQEYSETTMGSLGLLMKIVEAEQNDSKLKDSTADRDGVKKRTSDSGIVSKGIKVKSPALSLEQQFPLDNGVNGMKNLKRSYPEITSSGSQSSSSSSTTSTSSSLLSSSQSFNDGQKINKRLKESQPVASLAVEDSFGHYGEPKDTLSASHAQRSAHSRTTSNERVHHTESEINREISYGDSSDAHSAWNILNFQNNTSGNNSSSSSSMDADFYLADASASVVDNSTLRDEKDLIEMLLDDVVIANTKYQC